MVTDWACAEFHLSLPYRGLEIRFEWWMGKLEETIVDTGNKDM